MRPRSLSSKKKSKEATGIVKTLKFHDIEARPVPAKPRKSDMKKANAFSNFIQNPNGPRLSKLHSSSLSSELNELRSHLLLSESKQQPDGFNYDPRFSLCCQGIEKDQRDEKEGRRAMSEWERTNVSKLSKKFVYDKYEDYLYYRTQTTRIDPEQIRMKLRKSQEEIKKIEAKNNLTNPRSEVKAIIQEAKRHLTSAKSARPKEVKEKESLLEENTRLKSMISNLKEKGLTLQNENMNLSKKCQIANQEIDDFFLRYEGVRIKLKALQESKIILDKGRVENAGLGYLKELEERFGIYGKLLEDCMRYKVALEEAQMQKKTK